MTSRFEHEGLDWAISREGSAVWW